MEINLRRAGAHIAFKSGVKIAHRLPIKTQLADCSVIETGIAHIPLKRRHDRSQRRLRRQSAHGIERRVDHINARIDRRQHRRR